MLQHDAAGGGKRHARVPRRFGLQVAKDLKQSKGCAGEKRDRWVPLAGAWVTAKARNEEDGDVEPEVGDVRDPAQGLLRSRAAATVRRTSIVVIEGRLMAQAGDSRAIFVVQRHFRVVRRGYDPEEVDRHLQLVSEWFSKSGAGRFARQFEATLSEREARLEDHQQLVSDAEHEARRLIEGARVEAEATLEGARLKAKADAAGIEDAARQDAADALGRLHDAEALLERACDEAETLRASAEEERRVILDEARLDAMAAEVMRAAKVAAERILADAEARAAALLAEAETRVQKIDLDAESRAQQQLAAARIAGEQLVAAMRAEAAEAIAGARAAADEELRIYVERRRREADRLADAARRQRRDNSGNAGRGEP